MTQQLLPADLRYMVRSDVADVAALMGAVERTVEDWMRDRHTVGVVARYRARLTGFTLYRFGTRQVDLLLLSAEHSADAARLLAWVLDKAGTPSHTGKRVGLYAPYRLLVPVAGTRGWTSGPRGLLDRLRVCDLPAVDPTWLTADVRALAGVEPHPPLPIMADALQDAGCADEGLLGVFRADGPVAARVFAGLRGALRGE